ncbi:MAG: hypothetical protein R2727_06455 [Bacteroidales bacterium]
MSGRRRRELSILSQLHRKEIPVKFRNADAIMIVLIDVTLLEVARKQEAKANEAKSGIPCKDES